MRFPYYCSRGLRHRRSAELGFDQTTPWPDQVDLSALLPRLIKTIRANVVMPEATALVVALWTAHTHALGAFEATPRLLIRSSRRGSGKSMLLGLLSCLVPRPLDICAGTARAILSSLGYRPTFLIDDAPDLINGREMRALIRNGSRRLGCRLLRIEDGRTEDIELFAAAAIAVNGPSPAFLAGRSIEICLEPSFSAEGVLDPGLEIPEEILRLQLMMARWGKDNAGSLRRSEICNRRGEDENWRPLLAIAAAAGAEWEKQARNAMQAMRQNPPLLDQLLADIRGIFAAGPANRSLLVARNGNSLTDCDRVRSIDLARLLGQLENRPWRAWRDSGQPITPHALARLLAQANIRPLTLRFHTKDETGPGPSIHDKGYVAEHSTLLVTV